eukprot:gnl/TRDRNA2_/TRDRNA2_168535_c3_seq1.p1 gnl/TRDRNA2_/TRDRNA2_168535_c3~~gnl/TRDRNA2_/TRDRNA2_168535_c3_seq1.p1  ORF type:complete len:129 (+),score=29.53 gnl/TRDRNA2_/TRDRNA2_168535_c3_seq1:141-527(+)
MASPERLEFEPPSRDLDAFVSRLAAHLETGGWEESLTNFARARCSQFQAHLQEMASTPGEHHLGLYESYLEFVKLTDATLDAFLVSEGLSRDAFIEMCRRAQSSEIHQPLLDALLSATELLDPNNTFY